MAKARNTSLVAKIKQKIKAKVKSIIKYVTYKWMLPLVFKWNSRKPIDQKLVVFADGNDRDMPDNYTSLYELCSKNGYRCVFLSLRDFQKDNENMAKLAFKIELVRLYAQARAVFLVEYQPEIYVAQPRPGTQVIQLWHACGMIKRIAYAAMGSKWSKGTLSEKNVKRYPMHNTYTLVCASSDRLCGYYQQAFRCKPEIVKPLGAPRTDIYYNEAFRQAALEKLHTLIPGIGDRKVVIYAPTFRGTSMAKSYLDCNLDYAEICDKLADRYVFLTKFHPLLAKGGFSEGDRLHVLGRNCVYDVSKTLTAEEAVCVADIMISDYSSITYDFMIFERPAISYIYDFEKYIEDRGIVDPFDELMPGPYVFNQTELIDKLLTVDEWFDPERMHAYRQEFMVACDGNSTQRIFDYVFSDDAQ